MVERHAVPDRRGITHGHIPELGFTAAITKSKLFLITKGSLFDLLRGSCHESPAIPAEGDGPHLLSISKVERISEGVSGGRVPEPGLSPDQRAYDNHPFTS